MPIALIIVFVGILLMALACIGLIRPNAMTGRKGKATPIDRSASIRWLAYGGIVTVLGLAGWWSVSRSPVVTDESQMDWIQDVMDNCRTLGSDAGEAQKRELPSKNAELLKLVQLNGIRGLIERMEITGDAAAVTLAVGKARIGSRPVTGGSPLWKKISAFKSGDCAAVDGRNLSSRGGPGAEIICGLDYLFDLSDIAKCR